MLQVSVLQKQAAAEREEEKHVSSHAGGDGGLCETFSVEDMMSSEG